MRIQQFVCVAATVGVLAFGNAIAAAYAAGIANRSAMAADYAVGIVNLGAGAHGGGTGLNLYSISRKGVDLIQKYTFPQTDSTGNLASPLTLSMNPAHDFVYVAYTGPHVYAGPGSSQDAFDQPVLVAFMITPAGLLYQWERQLVTGDPSLQGATLTAGPDYVIENTFPDTENLEVAILSQSGGQVIVDDFGTTDTTPFAGLVSGHISPNGKFYYSCRDVPTTYPATPANTVLVYKLSHDSVLDASSSEPLATSTDPVLVANVCVPTPPRF